MVVVTFRVTGNLRFLSHAETMDMFRRACVRTGIEICYTQGFNPRPRLSLPLPRSVGVESEGDLLVFRARPDRASWNPDQFARELAAQLPDGCELLEVSSASASTSFQPVRATYVFTLRPESLDPALSDRIQAILAADTLPLVRRPAGKGSRSRNVDLRPFVESITLNDNVIEVICRISPEGAIRVDEILQLLELDTPKLSRPIRRTDIRWETN